MTVDLIPILRNASSRKLASSLNLKERPPGLCLFVYYRFIILLISVTVFLEALSFWTNFSLIILACSGCNYANLAHIYRVAYLFAPVVVGFNLAKIEMYWLLF